jgi:hypothetical protein
MDSDPYKEKTTLPKAPADVSELVCVTALDPEGSLSVSRFGNINPIPFRGTPQYNAFNAMSGTLIRISPLPLGPTDPCSTAVHMEPFSSLVLKGLT